jgi:DNA-binding phage protein
MDIEALRKQLAGRFGELGKLAEQAGVSRKTVSRILNGHGMPNLRTVKALTESLQATEPRIRRCRSSRQSRHA